MLRDVVLRELVTSRGELTTTEKVGKESLTEVYYSKGGRTPLNTKMQFLSTCTHSLASIKADVNGIKLKKEGTSTN